jgi:hypothetical protein
MAVSTLLKIRIRLGICGLLLAATPTVVVAADSLASGGEAPKQVAAAPPADGDAVRIAPSHEMSAGIAPSALVPAPAVGGGHNEWLVIVIQAALAEKGCYDGPVNGQWDGTTQSAVKHFVQRAKFTGAATGASHELLQALREASATLCRSPTSVGESPSGVTKAKLRTEAQPQGAAARAGGKVPAERRVERAPRQSPGPAVFARPVGIGRF